MKSGGASGATQLMGLGQLRLEYRAGQQDLHVGSTRTLAAWTRVSVSSNPGWNPAMPGVSAASATRWPPAEPPVTTTKSGSPPCLPMCSFTRAMARFTSTIWAGQVSRGRAGSSTQHTHTHPRSAMCPIRGAPCCSLLPDIHVPPCTWMSTGARPAHGRSDRRQISRWFRRPNGPWGTSQVVA